MPVAEPHFDAEGIIASVHAQDVGLRVTTNNPERFKQIIYKAAAKLGKRVHIYTYPRSPNSFALLKNPHPKEAANAD